MSSRNTDIIHTDIRMDLMAHPVSGDLVNLTNEDSIRRALNNLINTKKYSRPFNRNVGSGTENVLFENMSPQASSTLEKLIRETIESHDYRTGLAEVKVTPLYDDNAYSIAISYYQSGLEDVQTFSLILHRTR